MTPDECVACGAGRFTWHTPDGHQPFCAAVKATWARRRHTECSVEGCDAKHKALGFCKRHYEQSRSGRVAA